MKVFKERFQPCCGFSLRGAVRMMSILNFLMILIGIGLIALDVYQRWEIWHVEKRETIFYYYFRLGLWLAYGIHVVTSVPMDFLLYTCASSGNTSHLSLFYYTTLVNTTFAVLVYYVHTFTFGIHLPSLSIYNGYLIYKYYECVVIRSFIKEVEDEREFSSANRALTEAEMEEFENGVSSVGFDLETKNLMEKVNYQRFKKEELEIPMDKLRFDLTDILGSGAFGCVYRAQLEKSDGYEITVAVKMVNPENTDVIYFKALLTELKIMSYVGKHDNVIQLIGTCTKDIKNRKLSIVLEFCAFGNMNDYLKGCRGLFRNFVRDGSICVKPSQYDASPFNDSELVSTEDLVRWSYQVALGMEYLESRKVIHGDLAARNILLTSKRVLKITDFGLARQLYAYSVYVRKQDTPLPWRHLAIESLVDMSFSSFSDCWAYGIVLWEFFTLSEIPWPGYEFSFMFVEEVKRGLRLNPPPYSPHDLYENLMLKCWNSYPEKRPNFTAIAAYFRENYARFITN